MKKALFVANLDSFHKNFHLPYVKRLQDKGYEVELVSTGDVDFSGIATKHDIKFGRSPLKKQNIPAFRQFRKLIKDNYYDIIYFSTPVIGAVGRLALIGTKRGRVIYSAHGFSFYNGNSKKSNLLYSTVERLLTKMTDCLFTMNKEDYEACSKYGIKCNEIYNVDGVGVDLSVFNKATADEKNQLRQKYGFNANDFILIYPAEFTDRKNQGLLLESLSLIKQKHNNVKLLLLGRGVLEDCYKEKAKELRVEDSALFLGYRNDVHQLLKASDVLFASSKNEGLPINMMEAMASGLPVVATNTRGQNDLIQDGDNGFLFELEHPEEACEKICQLIENKDLYEKMSARAIESSKKYDIRVVAPQYDKIFGIE